MPNHCSQTIPWNCSLFQVTDSLTDIKLLTSSTITHLPVPICIGAFIICWTPGLIVLLLDGVLGKASNAVKYEKYCLVIAECNSLVNPIIYSLRDDEMRRTFKSILCWLCRRGSEDNQRGPSAVPFDAPQLEVMAVQRTRDGYKGGQSYKKKNPTCVQT